MCESRDIPKHHHHVQAGDRPTVPQLRRRHARLGVDRSRIGGGHGVGGCGAWSRAAADPGRSTGTRRNHRRWTPSLVYRQSTDTPRSVTQASVPVTWAHASTNPGYPTSPRGPNPADPPAESAFLPVNDIRWKFPHNWGHPCSAPRWGCAISRARCSTPGWRCTEAPASSGSSYSPW